VDPTLLTIAATVASPLLDLIEKRLIARLSESTAVEAAANGTAEEFPEVEGCGLAILKWCDSDRFAEVLEAVRAGRRDVFDSDASMVTSFVESSGFFFGEETAEKAQEVLVTFFQELNRQLYLSNEGVAVLGARTEALHAETRDAIHESTDRIISDISSRLSGIVADTPPMPAEQVSEDERDITARLDTARNLLNSGKVTAALEVLRDAQDASHDRRLSEETNYRLALNLGTALLEVGDALGAKGHYERATEIRPADSKALSALAKAYLVLGDPTTALEIAEKAADSDPQDLNAIGMRILALQHLGRNEAMEEAVRAASLDATPMGAAMLGEIRLAQGRPADAVSLLRVGLTSSDVKLPLVRMLLGLALVRSVVDRDAATDASASEVDDRNALEEADEYVTRALDDLEHADDEATYFGALASRAGVRALLGKHEAALADCNAVLARDSTNALAIQNKARVLFVLHRAKEALDTLDALPEPLDREVIALKASLLIADGRAAQGAELIEPLWDPQSVDPFQIHVSEVMLEAQHRLGTDDRAATILHHLEQSWPDDPVALTVRSQAAARAGDTDRAVELLQRAISVASPKLARELRITLAGRLYDASDFEGAVSAYREANLQPADDDYWNFLIALLRAGRLGELLQITSELRKVSGISRVTQLEVQVLELIGDYDGAERLLRELIQAQGASVDLKIALVSLYLRLGRRDDAKQMLDSIDVDEIRDDANRMLDMAEARHILGLPGGLELAYAARRVGFDSPSVHMRFIGLFLSREPADARLLTTDKVASGTTVELVRKDERQVVSILDEVDASRGGGEVTPEEPLAQKLMGLEVGSRVTVGAAPGVGYTIAKVQSKFVTAFQDSINNFPLWFPEEAGFWRVDVAENDLSNLLFLIDEQHKSAERVMQLYRTQPIPLGVIADLLGRSIVDVWTALVGLQGERLFASVDGSFDGSVEPVEGQALVLDLVGVLTASHLAVLSLLAESFRLIVPRSVVDDLRRHHSERFEGAPQAGTLGKIKEQYVHTEISEDERARARRYSEDLLASIEVNTEIASTTAALELEPGEYAKLQNTLGRSSADAILVAKEEQALLFSDDLRLRQVAAEVAGVAGTWTQPVLRALRHAGRISEDDYLRAVRALILSNYRYPGVSTDEMIGLLAHDEFTLSRENLELIQAAFGGDRTDASAIDRAADVIVRVQRQAILEQRSDALIGSILTSLALTRRSPRQVIQQLASALQARMVLDPIGVSRLAQLLSAWTAAHYM
jgi:tetratricopeptide (TPR) repeat protein/predicted nucleic acid-binding protein